MRTTIFMAALALASASLAKRAEAQAAPVFGSAGQAIISAERLFGLHFWSTTAEPYPTAAAPNPGTTTQRGTSLNLLFGADTESDAGTIVYSVPRLAFDYAVIPNLTVGATLGYFRRSGENEVTTNNVSVSRDTPSLSAFVFGPRVGYAVPFTALLGIWVRGGVTFFTGSTESISNDGRTTTNVSLHGFALSIDPQLVITPLPNVGVMVGPTLDLPLSGSATREVTGPVTSSVETRVRVSDIGLTSGLFIYF